MDRTPNLKFTKAGEVKLAARKVSNGNNFVEFDRSGHADFPHPALGQDITPSPTAPTRYKRAKANTVLAEHGLAPGTRRASFVQAQDARKVAAGPWGRPESF
jgi:hypothetical protein